MNHLSNQAVDLSKRVAISDLGLALANAEIQVSLTRATYIAADADKADDAWADHEAALILHKDATRNLVNAANDIAVLLRAEIVAAKDADVLTRSFRHGDVGVR